MGAPQAYREVLKTLRRHAGWPRGAARWRNGVSARFREERADAVEAREDVQLAHDYAYLVRSVAEHKDLLISYNISINRRAEQQERLKNTAARVGLQLPKAFEGGTSSSQEAQ